jgi:hypothetical protein
METVTDQPPTVQISIDALGQWMTGRERLLHTLQERIERNRQQLADADEESSFRRVVWQVWIDATERALSDVEYSLPRIEREAALAALREEVPA